MRRSWGGRGAVVQRSNPDRRWPQAWVPGVTRVPVPVRARLPACLPVSPCALNKSWPCHVFASSAKCDPGYPAALVQDFLCDPNFNLFTVSKLQLQHVQVLRATTSTRHCMLISNVCRKYNTRNKWRRCLLVCADTLPSKTIISVQ